MQVYGTPRCSATKRNEYTYGPISTLPPEILIHIFWYMTPIMTDPSTWSCDDLWALGRVCRRWREIVRSNPKWWAFLLLTGNEKGAWSNTYAKKVQCQLALSGDQLLHVIIVEEDEAAYPGYDALSKYHPILLPYFSRLATIQIKALYHRIPLLFQGDSDKAPKLPVLKHIQVEFGYGEMYRADELGLALDNTNAPLLKSVTLIDYIGQDRITLPWSQITTVSLHPCELDHVITILTSLNREIVKQMEFTPRFRGHEFHGHRERTEVDCIERGIPNKITFPAVERFAFGIDLIDTVHDDDMTQRVNGELFRIRHCFLSKLRFPALTSLSFSGISIREETPLAPNVFIKSVSSSLHELHLDGITISQRATASQEHNIGCAQQILEYLPGLTHITSTDSGRIGRDLTNEFGTAILAALELLPDLCPRLHSLELRPLAVAKRRIASLILSRMSLVTVPVRDRKSLRRLVLEEVELYSSEDYDADEQFEVLRIADYNDGRTELLIQAV